MKQILQKEWTFPGFGKILIYFNDDFIIRLLFENGNRQSALDGIRKQWKEVSVTEGENEVSRLCEKELELYFSGELREFHVPLKLYGTEFQQKIWAELCRIPYGRTVSYGELCRLAGCGGARAVGSTVGRNPVPILVPCHRVIRGDGSLGGFTGGLDIKKKLLGREGVILARRCTQSLLPHCEKETDAL